MQIGDIVKGLPGSHYGVTNEDMTKGVVRSVNGDRIVVKVLEHADGGSGAHPVEAKYFEVIGHVKPFDRNAVMEILRSGDATKALEYDLSGADLSGANLRSADLRRANLSDANLRRADLSGADLSGANLSGADLSGADLSGANLRSADLSGANLSDADLSDADLRRADLSGADLRRADLSGADLSDADLSDADLSDADLRSADLSGAKNLLSAMHFLEAHFEKTGEGYIAYKTFGSHRSAPEHWAIEKGSVIEEVVNPDRCTECGCGVNVAPLRWVKKYADGDVLPVWKVLIKWEWLPEVIVPYMTDGKIRCGKVMLLEVVS